MQGDRNERATANRLDLARRGGPATARAALDARPSLHSHARPGSGHTRGRTRRGDSVPFRGGSRGHRALVPGVAEGGLRMECPNTGTSFPWDHGPATEAHTCPFQVEINDDGEFQ